MRPDGHWSGQVCFAYWPDKPPYMGVWVFWLLIIRRFWHFQRVKWLIIWLRQGHLS